MFFCLRDPTSGVVVATTGKSQPAVFIIEQRQISQSIGKRIIRVVRAHANLVSLILALS